MSARWMTVFYSDGRDPVKVRIGPKAEVAFERHFKITMSKAGQDISAEHLYYLAWCALHYAGKEPREFDSFLDVLEDVEPGEDEMRVDPTQPGQPPEQSSNLA